MKQLLLELVPPAAPSFDNLVTGANAELIAAAHALMAGRLGERILYVWGEPGAGKSHLCAAVLNQMADSISVAADAIPAAPHPAALHVLEDVDRLDTDAQGALFNFLNLLGDSSILLSGSHTSRDLPVRRDLSTRVGSGLSYQMKLLSDAEKRAALQAHAEARGMNMESGIADYLLRHARRDMRSLIAMLDAIDRFSLEAGRPVTLPMVREAIAGHIPLSS
jgi:DnaA-homolog protein